MPGGDGSAGKDGAPVSTFRKIVTKERSWKGLCI